MSGDVEESGPPTPRPTLALAEVNARSLDAIARVEGLAEQIKSFATRGEVKADEIAASVQRVNGALADLHGSVIKRDAWATQRFAAHDEAIERVRVEQAKNVDTLSAGQAAIVQSIDSLVAIVAEQSSMIRSALDELATRRGSTP